MTRAGPAEVVVGAVQAAPVVLDKAATLDRVHELTVQAAGRGAGLVVFPEVFVPGYPDWVWRTPAWSRTAQACYRRLVSEAVVVPGPDLDRLAGTARTAGVHLVVGVDERQGSTLYNTVLVLAPDGTLVHRHRKLMPTGGERLVWGYGDGSSLHVVQTASGRLGTLVCWENYMPLARAALYAQDVQVLLAPTWDTSDVWVPTLRHIAKEGRAFVVGCCQALHSRDLPDDLPGRAELYGEEWLARGLTTVVAPGGEVLAGPLVEEEGIVLATLELDRCLAERGMFDPTGHYARPDVLRLTVDTAARSAVDRTAGPAGPAPTASAPSTTSAAPVFTPADAALDQPT